MTHTYDEVLAALKSVIDTALDGMTDTPEFRVEDPRYIDVEADDGNTDSLVSLVPQSVEEADFLQGSPKTWDVEAEFLLGIEVLGEDDDARSAREKAIRRAVIDAIAADQSLGQSNMHTTLGSVDLETKKDRGMPSDTLREIRILVEFPSLSPVG